MPVRPARARDADALGDVHVCTGRGAYARLLLETMPSGVSAARSADLRRDLLPCSPPRTCLVAVDPGDQPAGSCFAGPHREDPGADVAEICSLHVRPEPAGAGAALLHQTHDLLRTVGCSRARRRVLTTKHHARRSYERHGWVCDGSSRVEQALATAREHRQQWLGGYRGVLGLATVVLHDITAPQRTQP